MTTDDRDPLFELISQNARGYDLEPARAEQIAAAARDEFVKASPTPGLWQKAWAGYRAVEVALVLVVSAAQLGYGGWIVWQYFG